MVYNLDWSKEAKCLNKDVSLFFDTYEAIPEMAEFVDTHYCMECPIQRACLTVGVGRSEWGVWGGIYLEDGKISTEHNQHKSKEDWGNLWLRLTTQTTTQM